MAWRFSAGATRGTEHSWWLYAENNEQTAWAGETFPSRTNAVRAAEAFKAGAEAADFEVYEDNGGQWRWRAWRGGNKVASSGEAFASKYKGLLHERVTGWVTQPEWLARS